MIKNILIDLGNTLVNNLEFDLKLGLNWLYEISLNKELSKTEFVKKGMNLFESMYETRNLDYVEVPFKEYLFKLKQLTNMDYSKTLDELELGIYCMCVKDCLIEDAYEFLKFAKSYHLKVYIYSNSTFSKNAIMTTLQAFHINEYVDEVFSSCDVGYRKPSKEFFIKTKMSNVLNKDESIFIGNDYYYDRLFAKAIGVRFGWYNVEQKKASEEVDINFSSYTKLEECIKNEH